MLRKIWNVFRDNLIWFVAFIVTDTVFTLFLWLMDVKSFEKICGALLLGILMFYVFMVIITYTLGTRREKAFMDFLESPGYVQEKRAMHIYDTFGREQMDALGEKLRTKDRMIQEQNASMQEYEEYIEMWAHEIKTPIALMTFVLDNRKEEMSPQVYERLEYIRGQMQEDVERMLYYARIKTSNEDYLFEKISLKECCCEVLCEYEASLQERKIEVTNDVSEIFVVADKRGLSFILKQIISNALKYTQEKRNPKLVFYSDNNESSKENILGIKDNGIGVRPYDLPFIFNKGFTGESGEERKKATGMGLYLAKNVADAMKIKIKAVENCKEGFEIRIIFPVT